MTTPQPEPARGNDGSSAPDGYLPEPTAVLVQQIGQAVANAVAQVLQQVPVQVAQLKCATCVLVRAQWANAHAADIKAAAERMEEAMASFPPDHPIRGQADVAAFLPPHLQPGAPQGVPPVQDGAVMTAGSVVCGQHIPGIPQAAGGRREFLIANTALSPQMLAEARAA
jgi:hypothetical protein